ncbi:RecB family exonuclease [Bogoriella caseilytica]|uniref:Putative RecB family exonuclease n=1 Tax=Bogoriella caseilytica TaxID=56055 RepID=A0A3N2B8Y4_9MICO|nr:RecB family exonuclease [Bogoriella caseilytica]ROR71735.1 putative RecB family exonuclease [Bogoriella caseilytica]
MSTTANPPAGPSGPGTKPRPARYRGRAALSPSRLKDFLQCPLLFRLRTIDRLPEPPSQAAVKGTLVHSVLERLFDLPAEKRTEDAAASMLDPQWEELQAAKPEVTAMFAGPEDLAGWLAEARSLVGQYFRMEKPDRLEPAEREMLVETELTSGILLRGFVDRMDVAPNGAVRLVDYKTGKSPSPRFQSEAMFQMRFYALMLWRLHGTVPARLQLVYLGDGRILSHDPVEDELVAFEAELEELWRRVARAVEHRTFEPKKSKLCGWCSFQSFCPEFGGTPPEAPEEGMRRLLTVQAV